MESVKMKYIFSAVSLMLVTALVVIAPYGYNYINDNIKEGQTYYDGTFSYSDGKNALTYDETKLLLTKSSPIWINENLGTVNAEIYEEIYSALNSLYTVMKSNDYLNEMIGYTFSADDVIIEYCSLSKVSGMVNDEPVTANLMTVNLYQSMDYSTNEIMFMYNRENLKVYEYSIQFEEFDSNDSSEYVENNTVYQEDLSFARDKFTEYLECSSDDFIGDVYGDSYGFFLYAFDDFYNYDSVSYDNGQAINENFNSYQ